MRRTTHRRVLAFERLEAKASPSSLMLVSGAGHVDVGLAEFRRIVEQGVEPTASREGWRFQHDTETLLTFIAENTARPTSGQTTLRPPTPDACAAADEMMKLDDTELRALVAFSYSIP